MISEYVSLISGSVSITTLFLLLTFLLGKGLGRKILSGRERSAILSTVAVSGAALYPSALGLLPVDLYPAGYHPGFLWVLVLALALLAWARSAPGAAMAPVLGVLAFNLGILESENLWDYLIDPFIVFYAWGWGGYRMAGLLGKR